MKVNKKYHLAIILGILAVLFVAVLDIKSANSGVFGTLAEYTKGAYTSGWWGLFYFIVIAIFAVVPICYYLFYRHDKSESIAIFLSSYIMWYSGLADLFYFWFQGLQIPETMPWLVHNEFINKFTYFIGNGEVTPIVLYLSVISGFLLILLLTKWLEKIN